MRSAALYILSALYFAGEFPQPAAALTFDRYHDLSEINSYMKEVALEFPETVRLVRLGVSREGRDIYCLIIAGDTTELKANVMINAGHHGDEFAASEATVGLIRHFLEEISDPSIDRLLGRFRLFILPVVNPDGYVGGSRYDTVGIDPNRDYAFPGRLEVDAFQIPETRVIRDLMERHHFMGAITVHSGMEGVLWPWCYSAEPPPHAAQFMRLARASAQAMDMLYISQSFHDYETTGEFIDYAYMKHGSLALTFEISQIHRPPPERLMESVERTIRGTVSYLRELEGILNLDYPG